MTEFTKIIPFPSRKIPLPVGAKSSIARFAALSEIIRHKALGNEAKHDVLTASAEHVVVPPGYAVTVKTEPVSRV